MAAPVVNGKWARRDRFRRRHDDRGDGSHRQRRNCRRQAAWSVHETIAGGTQNITGSGYRRADRQQWLRDRPCLQRDGQCDACGDRQCVCALGRSGDRDPGLDPAATLKISYGGMADATALMGAEVISAGGTDFGAAIRGSDGTVFERPSRQRYGFREGRAGDQIRRHRLRRGAQRGTEYVYGAGERATVFAGAQVVEAGGEARRHNRVKKRRARRSDRRRGVALLPAQRW